MSWIVSGSRFLSPVMINDLSLYLALFWGTSGARLEVNPGGNVASNIWHETIAGSNFVMAQILEVIACLKQLIGNPG